MEEEKYIWAERYRGGDGVMQCIQCWHVMRPGKIQEPNGQELEVWFCDCGIWKEVNPLVTGEHSSGQPTWKAASKKNTPLTPV